MEKEKLDVCDVCLYHPGAIDRLRKKQPDDEELYELAEFFSLFSDTTRIKIIWSLFKSELCVCDLAELLGMGQSAVSHQLRLLRGARLVRSRRDGKMVYYSLDDEHVGMIFDTGMSHMREKKL